MRAEIIAVGSELLTPLRVDTNSLFVTERLNEIGIELAAKSIVGDNRADLAAVFAQALRRVDLVILTGGLGPTDDDLTRDVVADVLGRPLVEKQDIVERIQARFAARGLSMPAINRRQALAPRDAVILENPNGTAPGLWIEHEAKRIALLPGPPSEMQPMMRRLAAERLGDAAGGHRLFKRVLKITGRSESHVDEAAQPIYSQWIAATPRIDTTILAAHGQVELHLTAHASSIEEGQAALDRATHDLAAVLGRHLFSTDGKSLEETLGDLLRARKWKAAAAEGATGGLTSSRLTDVVGSSDFFAGGIVAYDNRVKLDLLAISDDLIAEHGVVSEACAMAMAESVRLRLGVDVGIAATAVAGPGGGSEQKPVGTLAAAVASPIGSRAIVRRFGGSRQQVKFQASQTALDLARRVLLEPTPEA